ncbi:MULTISPECIES: bifunctional lysylphosphatidylglycerol synthetase/lysine--tRNA ligase LysX [Streptomycetaceae]|uniref:Lysine--tRNA ligase n=1 Tax=Streptantibioticus cattleyicolor (strain ATCC 35852 / DSM 46488 / JCM 4925 / NBRC 14057 / NRRL 8057) TaxID=1003195 RepID=F8JPL3_STREN|nr:MULTISPECIES: bifunctional lysylphosphatidylglycerol synthetase/lysine--tRNA ligase LysX [Streptomycetaceae]AEW97782.1 lysyl-tRNA synthetase [Streptantibioticus cattleyicolor NRRL 8057 = DSM 46488]MYS62202.1 bifunctional lysylphosphatidylglycerol synthetase/lysine--tRNA ligase LysX [Streptomyces sp. SID5468]CCB78100.1 putative lysyl-tRNA synthetase 2 [Streptantibioticus cattleyicolor NRRL 8057 = DSM 46488]
MGSDGRTTSVTRLHRVTARVPAWVGGFFGLLGTACALTTLISPLRFLLDPVLRVVNEWLVPASPNLAYAVFLLLLAGALLARKRAAWWVVTFYTALLLAAEAITADLVGVVEAVVSLTITGVVLAVLLVSRSQFPARVRRGAFWRALGVLVLGLAVFVLIGWGLTELFPGGLPPGVRLLWAANRVCGGLISTRHFNHHPPVALGFLLGLFGALALLNAAAVLFRSQKAQAGLHGDEETRIRALLAQYGGQDSLGYFATRRDKAVVFAPGGGAAVTYRVEAGVCLASSDPVGEHGAWGPAIDAWLDLARRYAWTPAVMGAGEEGAKAYARAGLNALQLGDEAVLHTAEFDLNGREMRVTRQAVNRVRRTGMTLRVRRHGALTPQEMAEVVALADAWRDTEVERGFSMALGRLGDPADGDCLLAEAVTAQGRTVALLSFVPWGRDGISLDVMRRDRAAPNGVMEFMVAELAGHATRLGIRRISLNFAVFRAVFEQGARIGAGPVLRVWRRLLLFFSKWWQLEALYRSNVKYRPEWVPRFLCFAEARQIARIGLAAGIAEGFVEFPRFGRRRPPSGVRPPVSAAPLPPLTARELALLAGERATTTVEDVSALPEQVRVRRAKLDRLREQGTDPYPVLAGRTDTLGQVLARHPALPPGTRTGHQVTVAGRVLRSRDFGGVVFAVLRDWSGDLQIALTRADSGEEELRRFTSDTDLGDHLEVTGEVGASDRGEPTVFVHSWRMTAKCLRPLPDKRRGLTDPEARVRRRYVDLVVRPEAREVLRVRGAAVRALREQLAARDYLEVETPMLQQVHGGANARPFTTHMHAYGLDLYLRIAPELYLKRLCVGGVERVFELGRTFRNEGTSYKHNPEFTMLEAYQAFATYDDMLQLTRELIQAAATAAYGTPVARRTAPDGTAVEYDISGEWPVRTVYGALGEALGEPVGPDTPVHTLIELCDRAGVPHQPGMTHGELVLEMYERLVEEATTLPTFYKDFPTDVSPLTRQHRTDPRLAERWDLVAFGTELGTAYSELTDPVEQRKRLTKQSLLAAGGDPEAMEVDEDFLTALEYAMPPTGGLGLGVDRLVMFLTGLSIRDTLPFPLVRRR